MASSKKCPKCGLDLTDTPATVCPMCGTICGTICGTPTVARQARSGRLIGALIQIAVSTSFMLLFKFPKFLIIIFASFILLATAFSTWIKPVQPGVRPIPQKPLSHPTLFRMLSIAIALSTLAVVCILLFGTVMFLNEWTRWHQYEGQYYERNQFQVTQTYFQRGSKGSINISASGTVDGNREWMNLRPYVHSTPRTYDELYALVPVGTTIPIYFCPHMKGRARVQVFSEIPPAEESHRAAMTTLNHALLALAATLALIFGLTRIRNICFVEA